MEWVFFCTSFSEILTLEQFRYLYTGTFGWKKRRLVPDNFVPVVSVAPGYGNQFTAMPIIIIGRFLVQFPLPCDGDVDQSQDSCTLACGMIGFTIYGN